MRPQGTAEELERRRFRAIALLDEGVPRKLLAKILGVSPCSLSRWRRLADLGVLKATPHLGPARKLSDDDFHKLEGLLLEGATSHGWHNNLWTTGRICRLIFDYFGVTYHPDHVSRMLRDKLNWTCQTPEHQHADRDDIAIKRWITKRFPCIVRQAMARSANLVFVDEAGFMLEPTVRRTYSPRGRTPTYRISTPHARISAAGAIIVNLRTKRVSLAYQLLADNANFLGKSIAGFLRALHTQLPGPMTVLWDQIPIHKGDCIDRYLAEESDVALELFPRYAPELNPADGIWRYIKHARLPNYAPPDLETLRTTLIAEFTRLRRRTRLLNSFIRFTKLPLAL